MSKVLRVVSEVAAVVATVAEIGFLLTGNPIFASVAAIASAVAAVSGVAAQLTQKPPDVKGSVNEVLIGANMPVPYAMGRTFVGGMKVFDDSSDGPGGSPNKDRSQVFVGTHGGPIEGFEKFYADFSPITFASETGGLISGVASGFYGADGGYLWLNSRKGARPDTALTQPSGRQPFRGWTSAHKLSGMAAWSATMEFDEDGKRWASGIPAFGMVAKWVWAYDPRHDSTYPGGSGTQRWADESTWSWTENPALHTITYARGRFMGPANTKVIGCGLPQTAIDLPAFVELANICDANSWKVGGSIYEGPGISRWDNLKTILAACAAEPAWIGGMLTCRFSSPKTSLVTIDSESLADGDVEVQAMTSFKDRFNTVVPRYRSEAHKWEYVQSDAIVEPTYLTEDGEPKTDEIQYDLVQDKDQAARLAAYSLVNRREFGPIKINCKNHLRFFTPGEAVTLNIPEAGLVNQLAIITARSIDPSNGSVQFTLVSETTSKHAWALGKSGTAPPTPTLTAPDVLDGIVGGFNSDVIGSQVGSNTNVVRFSRFESGLKGWAMLSNPDFKGTISTATTSGYPAGAITGAFTAGANQSASIGTSGVLGGSAAPYRIPVTPNAWVFVGAQFVTSTGNANHSWHAHIGWMDINGTVLAGTRPQFAASPSGFGLSGPTRYGIFVQVPANAYSAWLEVYVQSNGFAGTSGIYIMEPMVAPAGANQTAWPDFTPGPGTEAGATVGGTWGVDINGVPANLLAITTADAIKNQLILDRIDNDNIISINEKPQLARLRIDLEARFWELHNRAIALGASTTALDAARNQWLNLITSYVPLITDLSQDTNIFTHNAYADELFPTNWIVQLGASVGLSGSGPYWQCSDGDAANYGEITRFAAAAPVIGQEYAIGIVVKKDSDTSRRPVFRIVFEGPSSFSVIIGLILNTADGTWLSNDTGSYTPLVRNVYNLDDSHWFVVLSANAPSGSTTVRLQFLPAGVNSSGAFSATTTGSVYILGAPMLVYPGGTFSLGRQFLNATLSNYSHEMTSLAKAISQTDGITSVVMNPISDVVIRADSTGVIKSGQLPRDVALKASAGLADVTSLCSWSKTDPSGITSSMGPSTGILHITAFSVTEAFVDVQFTYQNVLRTAKVHVIKQNDPPSTSGGSGGGGGGTGGSSGSTAILGDTTSTAYDFSNAVSNEITFNTGSLGKVDLTASIPFERTAVTNGQTSATGKWQIKPFGASSYTDVTGSETNSTANAKTTNPSGDPTNQEQGSLLAVVTGYGTGLSANTTGNKARFVWHDNVVSGTTSRITSFGNMTAAGS
jgi:hypothetical protein